MDIANKIIEKVGCRLMNHNNGVLGLICEKGYKKGFFELFADAYNQGLVSASASPCLMADALRDRIVIDFPELNGAEVLDDLCTFWGEWALAWDHVGLKKE